MMIIRANSVNHLAQLRTYRALTPEQIDAQCADYPTVSVSRDGRRVTLPVDAVGLVYAGRFSWRSPAVIRSQPCDLEVSEASELLRQYPPTATKYPTVCSYSMKHIAEKLTPHRYVSNGAMILALSRAGVPMRADGVNAAVCVSRKWIKQLEQLARSREASRKSSFNNRDNNNRNNEDTRWA